MKHLLLLLLPYSVLAQNLKSGTYYNLKLAESLVLDTGCYTFVGLAPTNLPKGKEKGMVWLDARKARSLTLINCRFEGTGEGIAVWSSGDVQVSQCTFSNMKEGIVHESPSGPVRKVSVVSSLFRDNGIALRLGVAQRTVAEEKKRIKKPTKGVLDCIAGRF